MTARVAGRSSESVVVTARSASGRLASTVRQLAPPLALMGWITTVLVLDRDGPVERQLALGVATMVVLAVVLVGQSQLLRVQTLVVVVVAGSLEFLCSPILEVYLYRFHNVPLYVPPAHGLVYLAAVALAGTDLLRAHARLSVTAVLAIGAAWAGWGLLVSPRPDVLGAFWFGCLVVFMAAGRSRLLFVAAFAVVGYLELVGTSLGVWAWQASDPTGLIGIGNPPSGIAGGYGWFDLAAVLLAPRLIAWWRRRSAIDDQHIESARAVDAFDPLQLDVARG